MHVTLTINGEKHEADVEPRLLLVHLIRDVLRLTGTHIGCDTTHCGACTVLLDGRAVKSCTVFAVQARGREIMTVEGLEQDGKLHPLQEGFMAEHGLQCGYCTPGMLMTSYAFLKKHPRRPRTRSARRSPATSAAARATSTSSRRSSTRRPAPRREARDGAQDHRPKSAAWATR